MPPVRRRGRTGSRSEDRRRWWEDRLEAFVELRSSAAQHASRVAGADPDVVAAHRALAEGAWYVLELSRQEPGLTTDALRLAGAHVLDRWRSGSEPHDAERWAAADWALWMRDAVTGSWLTWLRRSRSTGPTVGAPASPPG